MLYTLILEFYNILICLVQINRSKYTARRLAMSLSICITYAASS